MRTPTPSVHNTLQTVTTQDFCKNNSIAREKRLNSRNLTPSAVSNSDSEDKEMLDAVEDSSGAFSNPTVQNVSRDSFTSSQIGKESQENADAYVTRHRRTTMRWDRLFDLSDNEPCVSLAPPQASYTILEPTKLLATTDTTEVPESDIYQGPEIVMEGNCLIDEDYSFGIPQVYNNDVTDFEHLIANESTEDNWSPISQDTLSTLDPDSVSVDFYYYNIEEPQYHVAPQCTEQLLDCYRYIADAMGPAMFRYCISQADSSITKLTQGHFGCGKIWMDIKRYLEAERWSIRHIDFCGKDCWIGLLYSRRRESRTFAVYAPQPGFLRDQFYINQNIPFNHSWPSRRVMEQTEQEYVRDEARFFADKEVRTISGVTCEIGQLKFRMFNACTEDPAGHLENSRFLLGKNIRKIKNKRSISDIARKRACLDEERFMRIEERMADPTLIS